jgi:hypothetical protein
VVGNWTGGRSCTTLHMAPLTCQPVTLPPSNPSLTPALLLTCPPAPCLPQEALLELFGSGQASQLSDKLALYLHYMLDAGHVGPRGVGALQRALGLPPQQVAMWQCQQLLDEAQPGNAQDPLLQRACSLLAQHAGGGRCPGPLLLCAAVRLVCCCGRLLSRGLCCSTT